MKKVIIARGQHPSELSALVLARRVAKRLRQERGFDVEEIRMPYHLSFAYLLERIDLERLPQTVRLSDDRASEWSNGLLSMYYDRIIFNFHNSVYKPQLKTVGDFGFSEWDVDEPVTEVQYMRHINPETDENLNGYTIEIPAVSKPVNGTLLNKIEALRERTYSGKVWLKMHTKVVDLEKTREEGLMSERIENIIINGIESLLNL